MEALLGLKALNIVEQTDGKYLAKASYKFPKNELDLNSRIKGHKQICNQLLSGLTQSNIKSGEAWFIAANEEIIQNFKNKLLNLLEELNAESINSDDKDRVYMITSNTIELMNSENEEMGL